MSRILLAVECPHLGSGEAGLLLSGALSHVVEVSSVTVASIEEESVTVNCPRCSENLIATISDGAITTPESCPACRRGFNERLTDFLLDQAKEAAL